MQNFPFSAGFGKYVSKPFNFKKVISKSRGGGVRQDYSNINDFEWSFYPVVLYK